MNLASQSGEAGASQLLFANFNQDVTSLAVGSKSGYKFFSLSSVDKLEQIYECTDTEDVCVVERLFSSSLVAIVSLKAPRKLKVCHFKKGTEICNYSYSNTILAVKLNRQRLIVCLEESLYIHNIRDMNRFQQGRSLEVCQNLLWQLPSTPQHCLEFRMDFQMPEEMKQAQQFRKEDAVLVMYEMLQHIFNILTRDFSSTGWSETIIEHLREELYGQMNRLEPIQKEIMQKQNSTMGDTTDLHLRKYYFNLGQYLKAKEHNRCAWTVVQVQLLRNFSFLKSLTGYLRD